MKTPPAFLDHHDRSIVTYPAHIVHFLIFSFLSLSVSFTTV
uniref:Uncharacterized protein n=1 Tax=viral metagenome TaxID=1070528 RepID=A0A6C0K1Z1_9ZZZZ